MSEKRKQYQRDYMALRYTRAKAFYTDVRCLLSCLRCGFDESIHAKEFHHIEPVYRDCKTNKKRNILSMHSAGFHLEIQKCVVVCANCHRIIHATGESLEVDLVEYWSRVY